MADTATKMEKGGKEVFLAAMRHGILIYKPLQLRIGGKMRLCEAGEIVVPTGADLAQGENSEIVQDVASVNRVSNGRVMNGKAMQIFAEKKDLQAAAKKLRAQLAEKKITNAWGLVENRMAHLHRLGMTVRDVANADRIIAETIASVYPEDTVAAVRARLLELLGLDKAKAA